MGFYYDEITNNKTLVKFLRSSKKLNDVYMIKREPLGEEWIEFNANVGASLNHFFEFNIELFTKDNLNLNYTDSRFYWFYIDFIMSKPSNSIFTETPKNTKVDLFPRSSKKIALLANNLEELIDNDGNIDNLSKDKEFNFRFQEYFTNSFAYFDFIFYEDKGVFSKFSVNDELFKIQSDYLKNGIEKIENGSLDKLKKFCHLLLVNNINNSTKYFKNEIKRDLENPEELKPNKVYEEYINFQNNIKDYYSVPRNEEKILDDKYIKFEIFSYILFHKIWKILKILKKIPEFTDSIERDKISEVFVNKIKIYILESLKNIDDFYDERITLFDLYEKTFHTDYNFLAKYFLKEVFKEVSSEGKIVNPINTEFNNLWIKTNQKIEVNELLSNIIDNGVHQKYKFYRLIAGSTGKEIGQSIDLLHNKIYTDINNNTENELKFEDIRYIGILRSGSFLAHALNILKMFNISKKGDYSESFVHSFMTHPYLTILPRIIEKRLKSSDCKHFIYIDEAIKSGYGLSLVDNYRKKLLKLNGFQKSNKDSMYAFGNFIDYNKKIRNLNFHSLINLEIIEDERGKKVKFENKSITLNSSFDWSNFFQCLNITDIKKDTYNEAFFEKRLDVTKVISNSYLLFRISKYMAHKISEFPLIKQKDTLLFFAGSLEGRLLSDVVVFTYKILFPDNKINFKLDGKNYNSEKEEKVLTIFSDITIDSGYTKDWVKNIDFKEKEDDFDLSIVIFAKNFNDEKTIAISGFDNQ